MTNDELHALNRNREIYQIAFVTRDLERTMQSWLDNLSVGPWSVFDFDDKTVKNPQFNGQSVTEPFKFRVALAWVGSIQIEIVQPVYGSTIYEEFLNRRGEGLHHIKEKIDDDDIDRVLAEYKEKGIEVTQSGGYKSDTFCYLDSEPKLDFILELGNCAVIDEVPETYP